MPGSRDGRRPAPLDPLSGSPAAAQKGGFDALLAATWGRADALGLAGDRPEVAIDSTGLDSRYASRHFARRAGRRRGWRRWVKLTVAGHTRSHLIAGAVVTHGPCNDSPQFPATIRQAARHLDLDRVLGDAAYDAERHHELCRGRLGVRSTVIPLNRRNGGRKWPRSKYRRQMRKRFFKVVYRQRWQAESVFSRHKRLLGSALRAKTHQARKRECYLRVLTHNVMLLAAVE